MRSHRAVQGASGGYTLSPTCTSNALSRDVTERSRHSHWPASLSTNNIQCQPLKRIKGGPMFAEHHPLSSPSTTTLTTSTSITSTYDHPLCPLCLHRLQYAAHSIGRRNTWGAFPVRKEGPRGVWKGRGTGMWLDSSLAITQLTPARSERRGSTTVPHVLPLA
jgi:hypothetical protein